MGEYNAPEVTVTIYNKGGQQRGTYRYDHGALPYFI